MARAIKKHYRVSLVRRDGVIYKETLPSVTSETRWRDR